MKMQKRLALFLVSATCVSLALACGVVAEEPEDTSTAEEWRVNCSLHHDYHNKLIFSAVETTTPDGEQIVAWAARNRDEYLTAFRKLELDGVPKLKERRDLILKTAADAPGGSGITLLPELDVMVTSFWTDIEAAAEKRGVSCTPEENGE